MSEDIENKSILEIISEAVKERFIIQTEGKVIENLKHLTSEGFKKDIIRLQRIATGTNGWRTFIIATLPNEISINGALQWSASCKEELLDPEASDLYLIIIITNISLTVDQCISIEANEKFCRKFIQRPKETFYDLMQRTFLTPVIEVSSDEQLLDPLTAALINTAADEKWFNETEQLKWRRALLSGKSGAELIDLLFGNETTNDKA